jgi:hypothetical protein
MNARKCLRYRVIGHGIDFHEERGLRFGEGVKGFNLSAQYTKVCIGGIDA